MVEVGHQVRLAVGVVAVAVAGGVVVGAVEVLLGFEDGRDPGGVLDVGAVLAGAHHGGWDEPSDQHDNELLQLVNVQRSEKSVFILQKAVASCRHITYEKPLLSITILLVFFFFFRITPRRHLAEDLLP